MKRDVSRGFTIVELLIVIVVIGILAAITIVAYSGVQQKARDTQRVSDMKSLKTYVELYIADTSNPPITTTGGCYAAKSFTTSACEKLADLSEIKKYSGRVPADPINSAEYHYTYRRGYIKNAAGTGIQGGGTPLDYVIIGRLEASDAPTFTFDGGTYNYIIGSK